MNLTWHIVKKDFRRMWLPAVLVALAAGGQVALGVWLAHSDITERADAEQIEMHANQLLILQWIVTFLFTGAIVAEDPVVGARAFWLTRPISGLRLLRAKLVLIGSVFCLLPIVVMLPWWCALGYSTSDLFLAAVEVATPPALVAVIAVAIASLTEGWPRFLGYSLVFAMAIFAWGTLTLAVKLSIRKAFSTTPGLFESRLVVFGAGMLVIAAIVIVTQYVTRRTFRGWAMLACGFVVCVPALYFWPVDFSMRRTVAYNSSTGEQGWPTFPQAPFDLELGVERVWLGKTIERPNSIFDGMAPVELVLKVRGLRTGFSVEYADLMCSLAWADGEQVNAKFVFLQSEEAPAAWAGLSGNSSEERRVSFVGRVPATIADRVRREVPALEIKSRFTMRPVKFSPAMPVVVGATMKGSARAPRILDVAPPGQQSLRLGMSETLPAPFLALRWNQRDGNDDRGSLEDSYVVSGPSEEWAFLGQSWTNRSQVRIATAQHKISELHLRSRRPYPSRDRSATPSLAWMRDAVIAEAEYGSRVDATCAVTVNAPQIDFSQSGG